MGEWVGEGLHSIGQAEGLYGHSFLDSRMNLFTGYLTKRCLNRSRV